MNSFLLVVLLPEVIGLPTIYESRFRPDAFGRIEFIPDDLPGDVLTLFLIGAGFLVPAEHIVVDDTNRIEALKAKLSGGIRHFKNKGDFQRAVQSLSEWLEQFPSRAEVHELVGYDS